MRPLDKVRTVSPDTPASDCFEVMATADVHQLPVLDGGQVQGVVSRADLIRVLQNRVQLGR